MSATPAPVSDGPHTRAVGARTGAFFTAHGRTVFAVCRAILRDADEAADATQATFLSAHEALLKGAEIRDPGAWLATIARNECRGRVQRRQGRPLPLRVEEFAGSITTEDDVERRATVSHLRAAIADLPEQQREAVVLRDLYGLRYGEIGAALGVSLPSVEALLFRARRTLRVRLRPLGAVLVVPPAVREGVAQAVPWFAQKGGPAAAVPAAAGVGMVAKFSGLLAAKIAVGAAVVGITGSTVTDRGVPARPVDRSATIPHHAPAVWRSAVSPRSSTSTGVADSVAADPRRSPADRAEGEAAAALVPPGGRSTTEDTPLRTSATTPGVDASVVEPVPRTVDALRVSPVRTTIDTRRAVSEPAGTRLASAPEKREAAVATPRHTEVAPVPGDAVTTTTGTAVGADEVDQAEATRTDPSSEPASHRP